MRTFTLTLELPSNNVRDSVHIAQMLREAAGNIEFMIPMEEHRHYYDRYGVQKYEWTVAEPEAPPAARRVG